MKNTRQLIKASFYEALLSSKKKGQLKDDLNIPNCVDYLLSAVNGLVVTNRLEQNKTASHSSVLILIEVLRSWQLKISDNDSKK